MKKILFLLVVMGSITASAQRMIDKEVGDFNKIKVFDLIEVNLIKSDENRIIIKGENVYDIKFVNTDGTLKLRMQLEKKFTGEDTFIEVFYKHLDVIDGNEGAKIVCNELIEQDHLEIRSQEGAQIKAGLNVVDLEVRAVTGGIVEASGLAKNQWIVLNTGGIFEGKELQTSYTDVKITAAGEAEVFASEKVDIKVRAGGDVYVYGNPREVNKKTLAGGRVHIID
ncbi:head GIN domain-containing protein [Maribacter sp. TH_r10]|uniref:head GIN domain-containing protein n=1 Tax=Maribacter sp. TH_r10 TaxID=3082086 RepID=UPI002953A63F|nr:head GIN domain-containing protein [Maribacter sp. TH_r10]MDV7140620.1 head GIN domain-containing protein [Maribacter sp. TH_r10]